MKKHSTHSLSIFEVSNYRTFIQNWISSQDRDGRGQRARLAQALRCQLPFVSHVLSGRNDLSLEQAEACARFMKLTGAEAEYFVFLTAYERAGTTQLKIFYREILDRIKNAHDNLATQVKSKTELSHQDQAIYYSDWTYAAIHMACTVSHLQSIEALAKYFLLPETIITTVLKFLQDCNLVKKSGNRFFATDIILHLNKNSIFITGHHSNWRRLAIESLRASTSDDLHYSGVFTCSSNEVEKIRGMLKTFLGDLAETVKEAPSQKLQVINFDFFGLGSN